MRKWIALGSVMVVAGARCLFGQTDQMAAAYKGIGDGSHGKCTVDLVVDGVVELEIRGNNLRMRTLSGQPARGRRFECSGPVPLHPANFRFDPQEGRGRQSLVRDPRDGGPIVVRIEDPQSGSEGYKFDFYWDLAGAPGPAMGRDQPPPPYSPDRDRGYQGDRSSGRPDSRGGDSYRDQDNYHRDRDQWQSQDWPQRLFDRVRQDVEHVRSAYQSDDDQRRLSRVLRELNELQGSMARGRYDNSELDDVIEWMQRVLRENRLPQRDGQLLSDDSDRLRDFRARQQGPH